MSVDRLRLPWVGTPALPIAAALSAVLAAGTLRYLQDASFWLDEASVALSLRETSPGRIFGPLERGQMFPRFYLLSILGVRSLFGYSTAALRFLPFVAFVVAATTWALLLAKRTRSLPVGIVAAGFLLGATHLLDQSAQLKPYTLDAALATMLFLLPDRHYDALLAGSGHSSRWWMLAFALPVLFSYVYPIALGARLLGCLVWRTRLDGRPSSVARISLVLAVVVSLLGVLYLVDLRHGLAHRADLGSYWGRWILSERLEEGLLGPARLVAEFLWGWYDGRLGWALVPLVALLQAAGIISCVLALWRRTNEPGDGNWGSRSLGSALLLGGTIAASLLCAFPLHPGRLTLFTQVQGQLVALEGLLFLSAGARARPGRPLVVLAVVLIASFGLHRYAFFLRSEPPEDLRALLPMVTSARSDTLWVHPCSVPQARTLPEPFPVPHVLVRTRRNAPPRGKPIWVLWTHLGESRCVDALEELRSTARSWEVVAETPSGGLALATY